MKRAEQSPVASQRVADIVAERILAGQLKPGDRIKQDELASELNLSRIPVRDALRILETRGLVSLRANAGARVASLTVRDMELSYRIRELLEPMLLAESIPHLSEADFAEMRENRQHEVLGFAHPDDLRASFPAFFEASVRPWIGDAVAWLSVTIEGRRWLAQLDDNVRRAPVLAASH